MTNKEILEKYGEERLSEIIEKRKQYYKKNRTVMEANVPTF